MGLISSLCQLRRWAWAAKPSTCAMQSTAWLMKLPSPLRHRFEQRAPDVASAADAATVTRTPTCAARGIAVHGVARRVSDHAEPSDGVEEHVELQRIRARVPPRLRQRWVLRGGAVPGQARRRRRAPPPHWQPPGALARHSAAAARARPASTHEELARDPRRRHPPAAARRARSASNRAARCREHRCDPRGPCTVIGRVRASMSARRGRGMRITRRASRVPSAPDVSGYQRASR